MRYILQVLGKIKNYERVNYTIQGKTYNAQLSSDALAHHFGGDYRIILLAPESLVALTANSKDEAVNLLKQWRNFEEDLRDKITSANLLESPFDVKVMQSFGKYSTRHQFDLVFNNSIDNIISYQLMTLLNLPEQADELIVDVSTGFNTQVTALLEAIRPYIVFRKLKGLLQHEKKINVKLAFTPPVSKPGEYEIELYDYDVKAFFEYPLRNISVSSAATLLSDALPQLKREVSEKFKERWGSFTEAIGTAKRAFNALKYNIPLAFFYDDIISGEDRFAECLEILFAVLDYLEKLRTIEVKEDKVVITRHRIGKQNFMNSALTLALYSTVIKFKNEVIHSKPTTNLLRDIFKRSYESLGLQLNERFLEKDLKDLEAKHGINVIPFDEKRNFFAHSGLVESFIKVSVDDTNLELQYEDDRLPIIKGWIKDPS
ncbi:MAG: TM1812 family CRISPR-associated protein [Nitrososphaerales archaeon]